MIDTLRIYEDLKDEIAPSAAKKIAETLGRLYEELLNAAMKKEFEELRNIIGDFAEAQKRTQPWVEELAEEVKKFALSFNTNLVKRLASLFT